MREGIGETMGEGVTTSGGKKRIGRCNKREGVGRGEEEC